MLTSDQIRAARAMLRWDQKTLALHAGISVETIKRLEKMKGELLSATGTTVTAIRTALESAGIEFINDERVDGVVRLRK